MAQLTITLGDAVHGVADLRPALVRERENAVEAKRLLDERYAADSAVAQARIDALAAQIAEVDNYIAWKAAH
jgi:RNase H-fold protein (predicted Holliday junction resolvase)